MEGVLALSIVIGGIIMKLIAKLRKNGGQFDYEEFIDHMHAYENALKSLLKNKEYELLYKTLKQYIDYYKESIGAEGIQSYHPGEYYIISYYAMLTYAQMMKKGIKGVVEPNEAESTAAYLELLKRFDLIPNTYKKALYPKISLLLKYSYADIMDRYSQALYYLGNHYYNKKDYHTAFKLYKTGADLNCDGRQIVYPYYLIGRNQSIVADMYSKGLGVKKSIKKANEYYKKSASNCGREEHPKMGDYYLNNHRYSTAFLAYTEINEHWPWRYSLGFMRPKNLTGKFERIYKGLNNKKHKSALDKIVLAMMYKTGLGCERNIDKAKALMPEEPKWVTRWISNCWYI